MNLIFLRYSSFAVAALVVLSSCKRGETEEDEKVTKQVSVRPLPSVALSKANDKAKVKPTKYGWRPYAITDYKLHYSDYDTVLHGVSRKQFNVLENYVSKFDEVYASGRTKREIFYHIFSKYDSINRASPEKYFDKYVANLIEWRDNGKYPAVADLALANFYINIAWYHRGGSYADKVSNAQWAGFKKYLNKADRVLNDSVHAVKKDPNYYATKITLGMAQGKSQEEVEKMFFEGQKLFPDFKGLYLNMNYYLQPKWHGETDKSWYEFLEKALHKAKLSDKQKKLIYGVIVRENLRGKYEENEAIALYSYWGIDVDRFLDGLKFYSEKAPNSTQRADVYLYHAIKANKEEAIIDALKLTKGWYDSKRWKNDDWFVQLDSVLEEFPKARRYIRLDE